MRRVTVTSEYWVGSWLDELSKVRVTSVMDRGGRFSVPLKMTSIMASARRDL
jgi:hypothetical protein